MKIVKVGDISTQIRGVSYQKSEASSELKAGLVPVFRANNIADGELDLTDLVYVPQKRVNKTQHLLKGDVLIAASSGSLSVVGKAATIRQDYDAGFGAFCKVLRPNKNLVDADYFATYFQTLEYRHTVSNLAAGANINNLRNEHLDNLEIPLPPLGEQRRIAAVLGRADALRAQRRAALAKLDTLLQSTFLHLFGDPVTNPMGWEMKTIGSLAKNEDALRVPVKLSDRDNLHGQYPYYGASGIIDYVDQYIFDGERLLIAEDGANLLARSTPIAFIASDKFWVNNHAHVVAFNGQARLQYLEQAILHLDLQPYVTGSAQPKLNRKNLDRIYLACPPLDLQDKFVAAYNKIKQLKVKSQKAVDCLDTLFHSLQQRAFAGQL